MAEWQNGTRMAEWWNEGMVIEWRNGGMEEWRNGILYSNNAVCNRGIAKEQLLSGTLFKQWSTTCCLVNGKLKVISRKNSFLYGSYMRPELLIPCQFFGAPWV